VSERRVIVADPAGLHARQAAGIVRLASRFASRITIRHGGREADAKSLIGILGLAVGPSTEITLVAEGDDADAALKAMARSLAPDPSTVGTGSTSASSSKRDA
jgi:phosphotransferase system HPr (HPr) family protein